jgi:hypothetical protein
MVTIAIEEIAGMFKAFMKDAYYQGWETGLDKKPAKFTEWYDENYGDIIEGKISPPFSEDAD